MHLSLRFILAIVISLGILASAIPAPGGSKASLAPVKPKSSPSGSTTVKAADKGAVPKTVPDAKGKSGTTAASSDKGKKGKSPVPAHKNLPLPMPKKQSVTTAALSDKGAKAKAKSSTPSSGSSTAQPGKKGNAPVAAHTHKPKVKSSTSSSTVKAGKNGKAHAAAHKKTPHTGPKKHHVTNAALTHKGARPETKSRPSSPRLSTVKADKKGKAPVAAHKNAPHTESKKQSGTTAALSTGTRKHNSKIEAWQEDTRTGGNAYPTFLKEESHS